MKIKSYKTVKTNGLPKITVRDIVIRNKLDVKMPVRVSFDYTKVL